MTSFSLSGRVELVHGGGGRATAELIHALFHRHLSNPLLDQGHDAAQLPAQSGRLVMSTDAHVVSPLFFPGGDIGALSVHGTINDVAMAGARPLALSAAFILEEGLELALLEQIVASMAKAAQEAGVPVATGDTKVVERGKADGVFITTTGIGVVPEGVEISLARVRPGQSVLLSGPLGDHGIAILAQRQNMTFGTTILSDSAALHGLVAAMLKAAPGIALLRDPTRGGLAATLNEIANAVQVAVRLEETAIPIRSEVASACELLGLDPLHIANEGKLICICDAAEEGAVLAAMRAHPLGVHSAVIGRIEAGPPGLVRMTTAIGGSRVVDWISGEQLPRIC